MEFTTKSRISHHYARSGKHGVFSPRHNDRNYDITVADNIDASRTHLNRYLIFHPNGDMTTRPTVTFDQHEHDFYTAMFGDALEAQNEKHRKARNYDRIKTIDDYRSDKRTCPEEIFIQFGNRENRVDPKILQRAVTAWLQEMSHRFPNWRCIDVALHFDEEVPHMHARGCYVYEKPTGGYAVSQTKALAAMGIERPDMSKPKGQFNNPKQTWSAMSREILIKYARAQGLEIIDTPVEPGRRSMDLEEYVYQKTHAAVQELTEQKEQLYQDTVKLAVEREQLHNEVCMLREEKTRLQRITDRLKASCMRLFEKLAHLVCADSRVALEHVKYEAQDVLDACNDVDRDEYYYE